MWQSAQIYGDTAEFPYPTFVSFLFVNFFYCFQTRFASPKNSNTLLPAHIINIVEELSTLLTYRNDYHRFKFIITQQFRATANTLAKIDIEKK